MCCLGYIGAVISYLLLTGCSDRKRAEEKAGGGNEGKVVGSGGQTARP